VESRLTPSASRAAPRGASRGFSFIELIVVMGAMAMLMGLAVGFLTNIGTATYLAQAKAILSETAYRCLNASSGGRRAILTLRMAEDRDGIPVMRVGAAVSRPVLTHQFETLDFASEARRPDLNGKVEILPGGGHAGNAAKFDGGHMAFPPQSVFAMTEGLELDVWLKPDPRNRIMSIVKAEEAYEVMLVQAGESASYDVRLRLMLRKATEAGRAAGLARDFETRGGVLAADGRWSRLQVAYDGLDATVRVNGLDVYGGERIDRTPGGALGKDVIDQVQRIAVPDTGVVALTISSGERPYRGVMDGLHLRGVFRSEELERDLPGPLEAIYPALPVRIVFSNGGLDPDVHNLDQVLRFRDTSTPEDPPLRLTIGMYGTVGAYYEKPGEGGPEGAGPPTTPPRRPQ
jgi:hypothetical protein